MKTELRIERGCDSTGRNTIYYLYKCRCWSDDDMTYFYDDGTLIGAYNKLWYAKYKLRKLANELRKTTKRNAEIIYREIV